MGLDMGNIQKEFSQKLSWLSLEPKPCEVCTYEEPTNETTYDSASHPSLHQMERGRQSGNVHEVPECIECR